MVKIYKTTVLYLCKQTNNQSKYDAIIAPVLFIATVKSIEKTIILKNCHGVSTNYTVALNISVYLTLTMSVTCNSSVLSTDTIDNQKGSVGDVGPSGT